LRAILRQDPDIILVGEIRDIETAEIAVQASLTGHLVFSTLHTNDAPSTITRMKDMGIPTFLITATVEAILAQRLVRRICTKCREEVEPPLEVLYELGMEKSDIKDQKFYRGKGCDNCNNTGYKGRIGLFELMIMNDEMREMILRNVTTDELRAKAVHFGMIMVVNLCIGLCTPPVGSLLFVGVSIAKISLTQVLRPLLPFFLAMVIALALITLFPEITLFLPRIFDLI
jgi:type IV pilus assembly protein PilB